MTPNDKPYGNPSLTKPSSVSDRFRQIAKKNSSDETNTEFTTRNIGQNVTRAAEAYVGYPGALKKAFLQTRDYLESFILPEGSETLTQQDEKSRDKGSYSDLIINPPSPIELRERASPKIAEKITGDKNYLEPRNPKEKATGEITQDITSFFMPGSGQMKFAYKLGVPILSNLVKQGSKYLGLDESSAEKVKLGTMLFTSIAGQSDPGKFAGDRISQAKQMIPENATVPVMPLVKRLTPLFQKLERGLNVPSKSRTSQGIKDLLGQIQKDRIPLRTLMDSRDHINEWISEAKGWDIPINTRDASVKNLNELKSQIIKTVDENMVKRFPKAAELYRTGYEAAAVNHQSHAISNFIQKHFGKQATSVAAKILFPSLSLGGAAVFKTAGLAALPYPAYKAGQVMYRIAQSQTLAKYYQDVINSASLKNAPLMIRSMEKLDKALAEDEKKQRKGKPQSLEEFKSKFKKN